MLGPELELGSSELAPPGRGAAAPPAADTSLLLGRGEGGCGGASPQPTYIKFQLCHDEHHDYVMTCTTVMTHVVWTVMTQTKIQIRATEEQVSLWKEAAWIRKVSLSEWMRRVLDATAEKTKEDS